MSIDQDTTAETVRSAERAHGMARYYRLDQIGTKFEATRQATTWRTERVAELRVELEAGEQSVESFSSAMSLVSEEALAAAARQLKDLRERANSLGDERGKTESRLKAVAGARADGDFAAVAALLRELRLTSLADEIGRLDKPAESAQRATMMARVAAASTTGLGVSGTSDERPWLTIS